MGRCINRFIFEIWCNVARYNTRAITVGVHIGGTELGLSQSAAIGSFVQGSREIEVRTVLATRSVGHAPRSAASSTLSLMGRYYINRST